MAFKIYIPLLSPLRSDQEAFIELLFSAVLWGFGFVATVWAIQGFGPFWTTSLRFLLPVLGVSPYLLSRKVVYSAGSQQDFYLSGLPGFLLALTLVLQTFGLRYTSVTNSSFITSLYVVFVPLIEPVFLKSRVHPLHVLFVILGIGGTALIAGFQGSSFNWGDFLTLGCALAASLHIVSIAHVGRRINSPFTFNLGQAFWAGILCLPLAILTERLHLGDIPGVALAGVGFLAIGSTLLAFTIQIRAQTRISPSTVSILFLLEAPIATVFACLILHERLRPSQVLGAFSIILSGMGVVWLALRSDKKTFRIVL